MLSLGPIIYKAMDAITDHCDDSEWVDSVDKSVSFQKVVIDSVELVPEL
jgi:hypothetical protein